MGYIYMLLDKRNGKKYIGKHNGSYKDYWSGGIIPNNIANKYGKDVFERVILLEDLETNEILNEKEKYYIKLHNTIENGYNLTEGGDGGNDWMKYKTKEELKDIKLKKSKSLSGRTFSDETRKKMSNSAKNKVFTKEHRENIGKGVKKRGGIPHTKETKEKLSKVMSGRKNPKHSEFMSKNNPKNQKVSINGVLYDTIKDAANILKMSRSSVKYRLNSNNEKYNKWYKIKNEL
jgi:group I intron endonuclease